MKQSEIKQLSTNELIEKLNNIKESYAKLKSTHSITPLENPIQLRSLRHSVARLATELTNREGK